jgi:hypothetical protein
MTFSRDEQESPRPNASGLCTVGYTGHDADPCPLAQNLHEVTRLASKETGG